MTRPRHLVHPDRYYHCVVRGNNKQNIFSTTTDMIALLEAFQFAYEKSKFRVLAFCFMTNHYHVVIQTPNKDLSFIMATINRKYSDYYRRRYKYVGRIYQKPFWSKEIDSLYGLLEVSAYIHRNPIQTSVPMVSELAQYPFSTYPYYKTSHEMNLDFLDLTVLPTCLRLPYEKTTEGYCEFVLSKVFYSEDDINDEDWSITKMTWKDESYRFSNRIASQPDSLIQTSKS
ncbi:transposase [Chryseomicrobium palamuruense]|uniref:Transposase n=1 Tax=Chryseomicrobium palamuruense TaxID=682973 RepID=A0ABV8UUB8_9BACL